MKLKKKSHWNCFYTIIRRLPQRCSDYLPFLKSSKQASTVGTTLLRLHQCIDGVATPAGLSNNEIPAIGLFLWLRQRALIPRTLLFHGEIRQPTLREMIICLFPIFKTASSPSLDSRAASDMRRRDRASKAKLMRVVRSFARFSPPARLTQKGQLAVYLFFSLLLLKKRKTKI